MSRPGPVGYVSTLRLTRAEYDRLEEALTDTASYEYWTWHGMKMAARADGAVNDEVYAAWGLLHQTPDWSSLITGLYDRDLSDSHIQAALLRICRGLR